MGTPPSRRSKIGKRIALVLVVLLVLGVIGAVLQALREATASPKDKAACTATASLIETNGQNFTDAMRAWGAADDEKIRVEIQKVQAAAFARDTQALAAALNRVVERCGRISKDFRTRFNNYCKSHEGACKRNFSF